jgi:CheY-like chemotaxis protein
MRKLGQESTSGRILLVEDDEPVANALAYLLKAAGYHVDLAYHGREALEKVAAGEYDLIICDVRMPVMDGEAFYRELRRSRPSLSQRIVFCTGEPDNPGARRLLKMSGVPFIRKPFRLGTVLEMVSTRLVSPPCLAEPARSM